MHRGASRDIDFIMKLTMASAWYEIPYIFLVPVEMGWCWAFQMIHICVMSSGSHHMHDASRCIPRYRFYSIAHNGFRSFAWYEIPYIFSVPVEMGWCWAFQMIHTCVMSIGSHHMHDASRCIPKYRVYNEARNGFRSFAWYGTPYIFSVPVEMGWC